MNNAFEPMSQFYVWQLRGVRWLCCAAVHGSYWVDPIKRLPDAYWKGQS